MKPAADTATSEAPALFEILRIICKAMNIKQVLMRMGSAHNKEDEKPTTIHVTIMLMNVACRLMFRDSRIVAIRRGNPRCEGQTFSTTHATSSE